MAEFWEQTPRETGMVVEATIWQEKERIRRDAILAYRIASLMRARRLPSLKAYLNAGPAKQLAGKDLERRRQEFAEMSAALDPDQLERLAERKMKVKPEQHDQPAR